MVLETYVVVQELAFAINLALYVLLFYCEAWVTNKS